MLPTCHNSQQMTCNAVMHVRLSAAKFQLEEWLTRMKLLWES